MARRTRLKRRRLGAALVAVALLAVVVGIVAWSCASSPSADDQTTSSSSGTDGGTDTTTAIAAATTTLHASTSSTTASSTTSTASTSTSTTVAGPVTAAQIVKHGPKDKKWIALTFDDNYQGGNATKTIAVLKKYDVPATFFVMGHYIDTGPKLAKEIAAAGFEVGDHTRSHANCPTLSKRALRIEIGNGTDHYRAVTGAPTVALFRPPGGFIDQKTCEVAAEKGFKYVVMWDVDTNDWRGRTASQITETVMGNAHNGAIVLMHMAAKHTAEALPGIITRLRDAGYELVPLTKMLQL
jgi:peptidoglycan/xylan/chitin deacetylase (PgdA/CDA1 family)